MKLSAKKLKDLIKKELKESFGGPMPPQGSEMEHEQMPADAYAGRAELDLQELLKDFLATISPDDPIAKVAQILIDHLEKMDMSHG
jgi:hypothetical protein